MIETFMFDAIKQGFALFNADPDVLFSDLFAVQHKLPDGEVDGIKKLFATWFTEELPHVVHGYPRAAGPFPLVAITLQSESEIENYEAIGMDAGIVEEEGEHYGEDILAGAWSHNYGILLYTSHPDATRYLYEVVKYILLESYINLTPDSVLSMSMSGADLLPQPDYLPAHIYGRQLMLKVDRQFTRPMRGSALGKAFKVEGLGVDGTGTGRDNNGVLTLINGYGVNE